MFARKQAGRLHPLKHFAHNLADSSLLRIVRNHAKNPLPLYKGRLAQLVRASRLHREGREFESLIAHHPTLLTGFGWRSHPEPHLGRRSVRRSFSVSGLAPSNDELFMNNLWLNLAERKATRRAYKHKQRTVTGALLHFL